MLSNQLKRQDEEIKALVSKTEASERLDKETTTTTKNEMLTEGELSIVEDSDRVQELQDHIGNTSFTSYIIKINVHGTWFSIDFSPPSE